MENDIHQPTQHNDSLDQYKIINTHLKRELAKQRSRAARYKKSYISIAIVLILIVAGGLIYYFVYSNTIPIPKAVRKEVKFAILYPQSNRTTVYNKASFKYAKSLGQLSFIVNFDGNNITFAEQTTPEPFNATTTFFSSFTQRIGSYATINTTDGQAVLTLPKQTNQETAVMNTKGTLLFASSTSNLSESSWTLLLNTLQSIQPEV